MTKSRHFVGNGFNESHLPLMSSNQPYLQNQYCYHSISFRPVHFLSDNNLAHAWVSLFRS
jgi:hypothetical protein